MRCTSVIPNTPVLATPRSVHTNRRYPSRWVGGQPLRAMPSSPSTTSLRSDFLPISARFPHHHSTDGRNACAANTIGQAGLQRHGGIWAATFPLRSRTPVTLVRHAAWRPSTCDPCRRLRARVPSPARKLALAWPPAPRCARMVEQRRGVSAQLPGVGCGAENVSMSCEHRVWVLGCSGANSSPALVYHGWAGVAWLVCHGCAEHHGSMGAARGTVYWIAPTAEEVAACRESSLLTSLRSSL